MSGIFNAGDQVKSTTTNHSIGVHELLGSGGQGEVYRVNYAGHDHALKWYFDETATASQRSCIEQLVEQGPPSGSFLWPIDLVEASGKSGFGYVMPLRQKRFASFVDVVSGKLDPKFSVLMTVGINLVESFYQLHARGLCYRDISFHNGFLDPTTGEVLICDNDNVTANNSTATTVLGTPDFMAPEIVIGKARPSRETDYFSLSVLLFYLSHIQHPLLGKKVLAIRSWDLPAREKLFGYEPVFVFDPIDKSNEAISDRNADPLGEAGKNALPYWNMVYPKILKDAFTTSFTDGIRSPDKRLLGTKWKEVLNVCRDSIFLCGSCGVENFYDSENQNRKCWNCSTHAKPVFRFEIGSHNVMLSTGKKVYAFHVQDEAVDTASPMVAEVIAHPSRNDVWGLCNRTSASWTAQPEGKSMVEVPPGKSVPLCDGTKVTIGRQSGTIRA